jgi:hypothetical protein
MKKIIAKNIKLPVYFTVDFEDFTHDYVRFLNDDNEEIFNEDALWASYKRFQHIREKFLSGKNVTFFVTGASARSAPKLIKKIQEDGHEIACHYNFHDDISMQNKDVLSLNLDEAIKSIENITGIKPEGFRAPRFAINPEDSWAYKIIFEKFKYDSSYKTELNLHDAKKIMSTLTSRNHFNEYFIFGFPLPFLKRINIRSGGTFLRFFPAKLIIKCLHKQFELGHTPIIYIHPYELTLNSEFWVPFKYFQKLSFFRGLILWSRQIQWLKIGHKGLDEKLKIIFAEFEHQGTLNSRG